MLKVSIITATYNSAGSIKTAIESVNNQIYRNIEHVFIDGQSKDETLKIINEKSQVSKTVISESDNGIYDALNKGIIYSKGDIIGLLHSDDFLAEPDIIEAVVDIFEKTNVDGVYGDLHYVKKDNTQKIIRHWKGKPFDIALLKNGWMPAHPTLFLRRSVYEMYGGFDTSFKIAADYDFILRIMNEKKLKFKYLPMVFCKMRVGGASNKNILNIVLKSTEDYRALRKNQFNSPIIILLQKNLSKVPQFIRTFKIG
ncbi:glycosyltransferase family 2 protein [Aegicerativicinus sediminis]|uniref:glycosyltransferase family 2 protein n=1 Tax=Aegicerativicinus sediminis TaxID=2893202 RepID=UPI001E5E068C|nr:glycosyltransferase family 2 protein [Aegicerativicinus sediminis]